MYLEFIKDIFNPNDYICVECGDEKIEGYLVKISSELIAIKTSRGIVIKKDADITNIYSIEEEKEENKVKDDATDIVHTVTGSRQNASDTMNVPEFTIHSDNDAIEDIEENNPQTLSDDSTLQTSTTDNPHISDLETAKTVAVPDTITTADEETKVVPDHTGLFETPKPKVKVVGFLDLSKIKDPRKKKNRITANKTEEELIPPASAATPKSETSSTTTESRIKDTVLIEKQINNLLQSGKAHEALAIISTHVKEDYCIGKFRSSLLLKRAQTYSALSDYEAAKNAYLELIEFNESIKSPANNLSHLYTELARLQNLTDEPKEVVLATLKKALKYNSSNTYASTLFEQISSESYNSSVTNTDDNQLLIESEEISTTISKMIDIDIKEHIFTNEKIIKNGGISTPSIAKSIYEEAKRTKNVDMSERYPVYLEAAKAYSVLPVGSYDIQEYLEAVAYYAILKGNSLFIRFKKQLAESNPDIVSLTHIKDSACSYYIESLNLLSNIEGEHLLTILANYLKMNIALVNVQKGEKPNISGPFDKVFFNCVSSQDNNINLIAWETIVAIGTASPKAWNKLTGIKDGTRGLYGVMASPEKRQSIYSILKVLLQFS